MILLGLSFSMISCRRGESHGSGAATRDSTTVVVATRDTAWVAEFREMQDAFLHADTARVKKYFTFPIYSSEDEIWTVAELSPDTSINGKDGGKLLSPFRERDFDKGYGKLFTKEFVKGLSEVDVSRLVSAGASDHELPGTDSVHYSFMASHDSSDQTLHFIVTTRYSLASVKPSEQEETEFSLVGYTFTIMGGRSIRFKEVGIAD